MIAAIYLIVYASFASVAVALCMALSYDVRGCIVGLAAATLAGILAEIIATVHLLNRRAIEARQAGLRG